MLAVLLILSFLAVRAAANRHKLELEVLKTLPVEDRRDALLRIKRAPRVATLTAEQFLAWRDQDIKKELRCVKLAGVFILIFCLLVLAGYVFAHFTDRNSLHQSHRIVASDPIRGLAQPLRRAGELRDSGQVTYAIIQFENIRRQLKAAELRLSSDDRAIVAAASEAGLAMCFEASDRPHKALEHFRSGEKELRQLGNSILLAINWMSQGNVLVTMNRWTEAVEPFQLSRSFLLHPLRDPKEEHERSDTLARLDLNIERMKIERAVGSASLESLERSIQDDHDRAISVVLPERYQNIAEGFFEYGRLREAEHYALLAKAINRSPSRFNAINAASNVELLAAIQCRRQDWKQVWSLCNEALTYAISANRATLAVTCFRVIAEREFAFGRKEKAAILLLVAENTMRNGGFLLARVYRKPFADAKSRIYQATPSKRFAIMQKIAGRQTWRQVAAEMLDSDVAAEPDHIRPRLH